MKKILISIAIVLLCATSANASMGFVMGASAAGNAAAAQDEARKARQENEQLRLHVLELEKKMDKIVILLEQLKQLMNSQGK